MPKLASIPTSGQKPDSCPICGARVIRVAGGALVEECAAGAGNLALLGDLFGGPLRAEPLRRLRSTFRFHRCASGGGSFTAAGLKRKQR